MSGKQSKKLRKILGYDKSNELPQKINGELRADLSRKVYKKIKRKYVETPSYKKRAFLDTLANAVQK